MLKEIWLKKVLDCEQGVCVKLTKTCKPNKKKFDAWNEVTHLCFLLIAITIEEWESFLESLISVPINCLLKPVKCNKMIDRALDPNYICDATKQHWKLNTISVSPHSVYHTHVLTSSHCCTLQFIFLSCVPDALLWWWPLCLCVSVILGWFLLFLSKTLGHELVHWGASVMNLLLLTVPPLHSAVLEPDLHLKWHKNREEF